MKSVFLGIYFTCTTRPLRFCHIALVFPPHDHIKRQIKLARNSISNSDSFSRSLTATSISAFVLSLASSGQGQSFRLGRPHVRIAGGNLYMGGSLRSSSTSISTAYRRGCVVRSSPRPCYFCATSCPCSKKLSRSSARDRTALFIGHIVSKMTASALVRLVPTVPCCRARRHCARVPPQSHGHLSSLCSHHSARTLALA